MKTTTRIGVALGVLVLVLALGATSAFAHGGRGGFGFGGPFGGRTATDLLPEAAKSLGVTTDALKKAILDDAGARIDAAVKAGKLDADQAADIKDDLASAPQPAIGLTTATGVARNLGTTKAKLDDAFRAARKADAIARIDKALKDERIDADQAKKLKDGLADVTFPGYKGGLGGFGGGMGFGFGGHGRGGFGGGLGDGPGSGQKLPGASLQPA